MEKKWYLIARHKYPQGIFIMTANAVFCTEDELPKEIGTLATPGGGGYRGLLMIHELTVDGEKLKREDLMKKFADL
jgi:hypothetical protein